MLTKHLPKLALPTIGSALREPASGRGHMGEAHRTLGVLVSHLGDPWARHPSGSLTGLSTESVRQLVGSASFICLEPWLLFSQPCTAPQSCSSRLWMGLERNETLWQHPAQLGRPGAHLLLSPPAPALFPKKLGEKRAPLALSCATLGSGDIGKVKLFFLLSPVCSISDFFFHSNGVLELSTGVLDCHKGSLICGDCLS